MGPYLTTPKREKEIENGENTKVFPLFILTHILVEIRSMWHARMEKHHGGFTHSMLGSRRWFKHIRSV